MLEIVFGCLSPLGTSGELGGIRQIKIEPDELDVIQITVPGRCWGPLHRGCCIEVSQEFCLEKIHVWGISPCRLSAWTLALLALHRKSF